MVVHTENQLDATFAALASPIRRAILNRLATGEATVNEVAEPFDLKLPAVSKHLRILEDAGLVTRTRRAQFRPCALDPEALEAARSWVDACHATWLARFDRLEAHLTTSQLSPTHPPRDQETS